MKSFDETKVIEDLNSFSIFENIINENNVNTKYDIFHDHCLKTLDTVQAIHNNTDFPKMNESEVLRNHTNFFEYLRIHKLICEDEFIIWNL